MTQRTGLSFIELQLVNKFHLFTSQLAKKFHLLTSCRIVSGEIYLIPHDAI